MLLLLLRAGACVPGVRKGARMPKGGVSMVIRGGLGRRCAVWPPTIPTGVQPGGLTERNVRERLEEPRVDADLPRRAELGHEHGVAVLP